jgi:hypothetical protein
MMPVTIYEYGIMQQLHTNRVPPIRIIQTTVTCIVWSASVMFIQLCIKNKQIYELSVAQCTSTSYDVGIKSNNNDLLLAELKIYGQNNQVMEISRNEEKKSGQGRAPPSSN